MKHIQKIFYSFLFLLLAACSNTEQIFEGVPISVLCDYETRQFNDVRKAWSLNGNPDDFDVAEKIYREKLWDELTTDFLTQTGHDFDKINNRWVLHITKHGNPCRR